MDFAKITKVRQSCRNYDPQREVETEKLDAILEAQEDVKGGMPSYTLDIDSFNQLNEALKKYGYISKSVEYETFTGGSHEKK